MTALAKDSDQLYAHLQAKIDSLNAYVSLLQERIKDAEAMNAETLHQFADRLGWQLVPKEEGMEWRWVEAPENAPVSTLPLKGAIAPPKVVAPERETDGPVEGYGWRCNGVVRQGMPPASWKLADYLFNKCSNKEATLDRLRSALDNGDDVQDTAYVGRVKKFNEFCKRHGFTSSMAIERGAWVKVGSRFDDSEDHSEPSEGEFDGERVVPIIGKDKDAPRTIRLNLHKAPRARRNVGT